MAIVFIFQQFTDEKYMNTVAHGAAHVQLCINKRPSERLASSETKWYTIKNKQIMGYYVIPSSYRLLAD